MNEQLPPTVVQDPELAHEMANASNDLRAQAAQSRAIARAHAPGMPDRFEDSSFIPGADPVEYGAAIHAEQYDKEAEAAEEVVRSGVSALPTLYPTLELNSARAEHMAYAAAGAEEGLAKARGEIRAIDSALAIGRRDIIDPVRLSRQRDEIQNGMYEQREDAKQRAEAAGATYDQQKAVPQQVGPLPTK